jgi:hypothetical protein
MSPSLPYLAGADNQDGAFSYQYKLRPGVNTNSHAIVSLHLCSRAMLISIESRKISWYARIFSVDGAKYLGRATSYQFSIDPDVAKEC